MTHTDDHRHRGTRREDRRHRQQRHPDFVYTSILPPTCSSLDAPLIANWATYAIGLGLLLILPAHSRKRRESVTPR